jgi:hypothetical protein
MAQASKSFLALVLGGVLLVGGPLVESLRALDGKRSESDTPYPGGSQITFEWQYSCSDGKNCSFSCPGAGSASWPTASSSVATSAPLSRATHGGAHITRLAIHLGTIPLGSTEKAVGIFYEFSTKEIPRANGFSITTGISTLSCQVSGMDLDYSGPPRVPQVPQTNRSPKSDSQSSSGQGSAPIAR